MKKYKFVDPRKLLLNLIPAILDPENLLVKGNQKEVLTGLPYKEALGILILAESMNFAYENRGEDIQFRIFPADFEDPNNEDGAILIDFNGSGEEVISYLEQVSVTKYQKEDITDEILKQIEKKHGYYSEEYYQKHVLLIFTDKLGAIDINRVKQLLRVESKFGFYGIFCLEFEDKKTYRYAIANLEPTMDFYGKFFVYVDIIKKTYRVSAKEPI